jgi:hypothetical protein
MTGSKISAYAGRFLRLFLISGLLSIGCVWAAAPPPRAASAATVDDFEGAENSWRPSEADTQYRLENHARISSDPHSGQRSELLQISAAGGTYIYFSHELSPVRIVAELSPSVWIKANRPGIQLLARAILPHTMDPRSGQSLSILLRGNSYSSTGMWQQLVINDTPQLLSREMRELRAQLGPQIDAREAYVDQLLLNVYGGSGQTIVNIDDLAVTGAVPFQPSTRPADAVTPSHMRNASQGLSESAPPSLPGNSPQLQQGNASQFQPGGAVQPLSIPFSGSANSTPIVAAASTMPAVTALENSTAPRQVVFNGTLLLVDGKPTFPRIIQSQGEPLEWLKQEGFNVVRTTGPITEQMLAEAQQTGMRLIGPPPLAEQTSETSPVLAPITPAYAPVLAWHLGSGLATRELSATAALSRQLRLADRQLRRPLTCSPEEESLAYSRLCDVLCESRPTLGASVELKDYAAWLSQRTRLARAGTPLWAVVQTEAAPEVVDQAAAFIGTQSPTPTVEMGSLRLLTYVALCSGARGIEFSNNSRLDAGDNATRQRAATLALLNQELDLISPWGATGEYVTEATTSDPNISAVVLNADKARLVVAMRLPKLSQYVAAPGTTGTGLPALPGSIASSPAPVPSGSAAATGSTTVNPQSRAAKLGSFPELKDTSKLLQHEDTSASLQDNNGSTIYMSQANRNPLFPDATNPVQGNATTLIVPGIPEDYQVYELTPAGLRPLRHQRVSGGTAIAIEDFLLTSLVLITADPAVQNAMQRRATEMAPIAAQLQRGLTAAMLEQTAAVSQRLPSAAKLPSAATSLATAQARLQQSDGFLSAGQFMQAYLTARNATYPLEHWQHEVWEQAVKPLSTPVISPLAVSFNTLPEQLNAAASLLHAPPAENLLIGGDCENMQTMLQAGWQHVVHPRSDLQTAVELSSIAPYAGGSSLHMQVQPVNTETPAALAATLVESPPLWIISAPVHVNAGDIVCIRGQVRVPRPIVGSVDGLMIIDSLGGEALAQRITQTEGWHEFVMYRAAPHAGNLTVKLALTGLGEAWIDELSVRPIRRADAVAPANFTSAGWPNLILPRR